MKTVELLNNKMFIFGSLSNGSGIYCQRLSATEGKDVILTAAFI